MCYFVSNNVMKFKVILHYPKSGYVEIDPDELWTSVVGVVKSCLQSKFEISRLKYLI